ncbi:MAG TPA: GGDEF domain-containing protein [Candidatus Acidoferrum sp.]|nr:GGDEF domain-containing protein [Candidatus Acidoferrum sp.]
MAMESRRALEPMCALDPLLLIPRIEYVSDVYDCVFTAAKPYSLVILDMKNFHIINDVYGYDTGDKVIVEFMQRLRSRLPAGSISLRFRHGDEFLFFVPEDRERAKASFAAFRESCEATPACRVAEQDIFVSYRFAVIDLAGPRESVTALLARAERALRQVKGQGSPRA